MHWEQRAAVPSFFLPNQPKRGEIMDQNQPQAVLEIPIRLLAPAMAFVPEQPFGTPYEPALAFSRGTIFPALDLPFVGEEAVQ
jgi:hypothetical protein